MSLPRHRLRQLTGIVKSVAGVKTYTFIQPRKRKEEKKKEEEKKKKRVEEKVLPKVCFKSDVHRKWCEVLYLRKPVDPGEPIPPELMGEAYRLLRTRDAPPNILGIVRKYFSETLVRLRGIIVKPMGGVIHKPVPLREVKGKAKKTGVAVARPSVAGPSIEKQEKETNVIKPQPFLQKVVEKKTGIAVALPKTGTSHVIKVLTKMAIAKKSLGIPEYEEATKMQQPEAIRRMLSLLKKLFKKRMGMRM